MMLVWFGVALADCPPMERLLERATTEVVSGSFEAASATLADAERAMGCQAMGERLLARYWMVQGARLALLGEDDEADAHFAAARRVDPGVWDPRFGAALMARFDGATETGRATVDLDTRRAEARVDGRPGEVWPMPLSSGLHLVQVVDTEVLYSRIVRLAPGENALLVTRLPEPGTASLAVRPVPADLPPVAVPVEVPGRRSPALLVAASSAALVGGGFAGLAYWERGRIEAAGSRADATAAYTAQRAFAGAAYGLWGLAGAGVVLHFVLR